jgi:uncharacterized protein (UPF0147 family)
VTSSELPLPLADAVIFLMAFLDHSGDDSGGIHPDDVVKAMENACYELQQLRREQRQALCERADQLANTEDWRTDPRMPEFLRTFGEACGLFEED